jgi:hypothetical protein
MHKFLFILRAESICILLLMTVFITVISYYINHQNYLSYQMSLETPQKTSLPEFLAIVYPQPGSVGRISKKICASLNPLVLWEAGDRPGQTEANIESTFQLKLDNAIVSRKDASFSQTATLLTFEQDGVSGSVGGAMSTCLRTDLTVGLHSATLQVRSTSGKVYSYTWFFRVDETQPVLGQRYIVMLLDYFEQNANSK